MPRKLNPVFQTEGEGQDKGMYLRDGTDYYDLENIENKNTQMAHDELEAAKGLMMNDTTTENPLVNRNFVNSSISHMAANPRGNWNTWNDVPSDPNLYPADADGHKKPTNNDYMVVQDMTGYTNPEEPTRVYDGSWRFTYVGEWDDPIQPSGTKGKSGWKPIYQVNEKPLTSEQIAALNSGINATKVSGYDAHTAATNNPHSVTKAQVGLSNVDNTSDAAKPVSTAQQTALDAKVAIAQGSQNKGKILQVDSNGNLVLADPPESGGGATPEQLATKLDKTPDVKKIAMVSELPEAIDLYTMYLVVEEDGEWPGLKITNTSGQADAIRIEHIVNEDNIYYSSDGKNWTKYTEDEDIDIAAGASLYWWNKNNWFNGSGYDKKFRSSILGSYDGAFNVTGNIMSLLNFDETNIDKAFVKLFNGFPVVNASGLLLPKIVGIQTYMRAFSMCRKLTSAPKLPATELASSCYHSMFDNCSSLVTAPDLPCTNLNPGQDKDYSECYAYMFLKCTSLTSVKIYANGLEFGELTPYTENWLLETAANGTLYYNGQALQNRGGSTAPTSWAIQSFTP